MSKETELPELGFVALIRYAWRQLTSMRTALILLMLMGIAAIPGSLVPQRITNQIAVRELFKTNPELAKWYDRFYLFDVYGSPWFSAIYLALYLVNRMCIATQRRALQSNAGATTFNSQESQSTFAPSRVDSKW